MFKSILVAVGVLLIVFVAYAAWVIIRTGDTIGVQPIVETEVLSGRIRLTITMPGVDTEHQITEVIFPRDFGEQLEITAPLSFRLTPYTLEDTSDPNSDDAATWVATTNQRDMRWTGSITMPPDVPVVLDFPFRYKIAGTGTFHVQYERMIGMSGQIAFFNVPIEISSN